MCTPPTKERIWAKSCTLCTSNYGNIINETINGRGNKTSLAVATIKKKAEKKIFSCIATAFHGHLDYIYMELV
jgi:mRNA deadenylase 3'-5' endonuclease subunit Ccr4